MRTNIEIDDKLMALAMRSSGNSTKRATGEAGLRLLAQTLAQANMRRWRGKIAWEGDLNQSRLGKSAK